MKQFTVGGMSCAACSARVESAVSKIKGVTACSVNLLTNSMTVEGEVADEIIISVVEAAGYSAMIAGQRKQKQGETAMLIKRLVLSLGFLVVLMYLSMGVVMCGAPFFDLPVVTIAYMELILALIVIVINNKFYKN